MDRARSKKQHFRVLGYPSTILRTAYRKQFYPKPVVPMESQNSEDMPFAIRSVCDQAFGRYRPLEGAKNGHVTITKIENLHIDTRRKIHLFQKCYSFRSTTKNDWSFRGKPFQALVVFSARYNSRMKHRSRILSYSFDLQSCLHKYKRLACRVCGNALEKFAVNVAKNWSTLRH